MSSIRQQKVGSLIQRELSTMFTRGFHELFEKSLVTITVVRMSPDLSIAKVYLSILGKNGEKVLENMNTNVGEIRFTLGNRIRNDLRKVPELHFYLDDSLDYADKIEQLLNN
ncbi:MAG: 30S ribosome-binding factor RbfA [Flavobacteriales bacterium]|nr:30S ribosome-binding factor RbfA [Flavobacteriales bacterium]